MGKCETEFRQNLETNLLVRMRFKNMLCSPSQKVILVGPWFFPGIGFRFPSRDALCLVKVTRNLLRYPSDVKLTFYIFLVNILAANNRTTLVPKGGTVTLQCFSDLMDDCLWTRRGFPTKISGRYYFVESDRRYSDDCSVKIKQVEDIDAGHWSCQIYADHQPHDPIEVQNFWLYSFGK